MWEGNIEMEGNKSVESTWTGLFHVRIGKRSRLL